MSAWYVFATLGFYPVDPSSGTYVAGIPLTGRATIAVPGRPILQIERQGTGGRLKILRMNGGALPPTAIPHAKLAAGGRLVFET